LKHARDITAGFRLQTDSDTRFHQVSLPV
jgi:hypothetical protein